MRKLLQKAVSFVLASIMVLSCLGGVVFASESANVFSYTASKATADAKLAPTDYVKISVTNDNEVSVDGMTFTIYFDTETFTFIGSEEDEVYDENDEPVRTCSLEFNRKYGSTYSVSELTGEKTGYKVIWWKTGKPASGKDVLDIVLYVNEDAYKNDYSIELVADKVASGDDLLDVVFSESVSVSVDGKDPDPIKDVEMSLKFDEYDYDANEKTPEIVAPEGVTYTVSGDLKATDAGEYKITVTGTGKYQGTKELTWKINKAPLTVTGVSAADKVYDGKNTVDVLIAEGGPFVDGEKGSDVVSVTFPETVTIDGANVGSYTANIAPISVSNENYVVAAITDEVVVSKASVTAPTAKGPFTYDTETKTGIEAGENYTITGVASAANAGTYEATVTLKDTTNYKWAGDGDDVDPKTIDWTINKADGNMGLIASADVLYSEQEHSYEDLLEAVSETLVKPGALKITNVSVVDNEDGLIDGEPAANNGAVNFEIIEISDFEANKDKNAVLKIEFEAENYGDSAVTLTIGLMDKKPLDDGIVTFKGDASGIYSAEEHTYEVEVAQDAVGEWDIEYAYTLNGEAATEMKNVGVYTVTATVQDDEYIGTATGTYEVKAAPLTVTDATVTAKPYDTTDTATVAAVEVDGVKGSDTVNYVFSEAKFEDANAGENKKVTFKIALDNAPNYYLTADTVETTGTINKLAVDASIAAIDAVTYTGSAYTPEPVVTIETLNSEKASYSVEYANNTEAGDDATVIVKSTDKNYAFEATKTFVINKADATVSVTAVKKTYDGSEFKGTDVTYEASFNDAPITGTWNVTKVAGSDDYDAGNYTVDLVFKPANSSLNEKTFENVAAEITQATVKFEVPEVKDSNTMLGDLEIAFTGVDGTELKGTVTWADKDGKPIEKPEETKIEANTKYTFKFEPTDDNYADLVAEITPYEVSTGIESNINIKSGSTKHGSVSINPLDAEKGDKVVVTVKPKTGYEVDEVTVTTSKGKDVAVKSAGSNKYVFVMPAGQVTLEVTYKKADVVKFLDVADNAWYHDSVYAAVDMGLFTGVSDNYFQPDGSMTRAMLVTVLWRLEGSPAAGSSDFADVANGSWYDEAVAWANEEGIVTGISDASFAPNAAITREQMATMLYRYAKYLGLNTAAKADLSDYADADKISAYAVDAMAWAVRAGLINGVTADTLAPAGTATRAQVATILVRFVEKFL